MNAIETLSRNEMRVIKGGNEGNIHCSIEGSQWSCIGTLEDCVETCADLADGMGTFCDGCAQFPVMN